MGIFNEQSLDHPFAKGIQGAPGVGFNLTSSGDYDMVGKKLRNVGAPSANTDAATKKYVDDNSSGSPSTSQLTVDSDINMNDRYRITNLITPQDSKDPATKYYVDNKFLDRDGSYPMKGNLNMDNNQILNLPAPAGPKQPTPLAFTDMKYLHVGGTNKMTNNLNMDNKGIIHLKTPTNDTDGATKKYVDDSIPDTSSFIKKDGSVSMTSNLNLGGNKIVGLTTPTSNTDAATKKYVDDNTAAPDLSDYLEKDGTVTMTGNLNLGNNKIVGLATPVSNTDAATKKYVDDNAGSPDLSNYLKKDGSVAMTGNLNLGNKKIVGLATPTSNTDATTKKYVDDNTAAPDLSDYLEKDGSVAMTGELNGGGNKIINIGKPLQNSDAATKDYVDKLVHSTAVQPSHYNNQFAYLMSSGAQWTDEIDSGNSFVINRIDDLPPKEGNFHDYNHKVIYMYILKSSSKYKYKMGINFYRISANTDYTLCLEILNTDYNLWNKTQISVDKGTSTGLSIGNVGIRKLSHRYTDSTGKTQTMYYHRIIVNFRKLSSGNKFFLHILVDISRRGYNIYKYPLIFQGVYIIAYGIVGTFSNIDPDKVYDYHTAFDIKPTEVAYNVDINANNKKILNINLDRNSNNSAATVALVKELAPHTKNSLYRLYFSEFYDFTDADLYGLSRGVSGVIFNSLRPNITLPNRDLNDITNYGLNVKGYPVHFDLPNYITKYSLCISFHHWRNRSFSLTKKNTDNDNILLKLNYDKTNNKVTLTVNKTTQNFTMLSSFNGQRIVVWLLENFSANVTKVSISNYSATLTIPAVQYSHFQQFDFTTEDGVLNKLMYSPNFYDTDSEQYHKVMLQEKLSGSYIM